jgi:hypothetical protein
MYFNAIRLPKGNRFLNSHTSKRSQILILNLRDFSSADAIAIGCKTDFFVYKLLLPLTNVAAVASWDHEILM